MKKIIIFAGLIIAAVTLVFRIVSSRKSEKI